MRVTIFSAAPVHRLLDRCTGCQLLVKGVLSAIRNVWSAALSQAKNEGDTLVCANVYGLRWSIKLLALMECAAPSSYLVSQSWKTSSGYRFGERRVRPLCHLMLRQQTWQ